VFWEFASATRALLDWASNNQLVSTVFAFFRTAEVYEFAEAIASEYDRLLRSTAMRHDTPAKREQKFDKLLEKVDAYSREKNLNFYKKSRMLYALKQGLAKKGVSESDADSFVRKIVMRRLVRR
jgi:hypothetical protein